MVLRSGPFFLLSITVCWFLSDGSGGWCMDMNFSQNDKTINRDSKQAFRALVFAVNAHKYVLLNFEGKKIEILNVC